MTRTPDDDFLMPDEPAAEMTADELRQMVSKLRRWQRD
jgi:hypothetical protein